MYPTVFVYTLFILHSQIARAYRAQRTHSRRHTALLYSQRYPKQLTSLLQRDRVSGSVLGSEQNSTVMPDIQVCPSRKPTRITLRMGRPPIASLMLDNPPAPPTQAGQKVKVSHHEAPLKPRTREDWIKCLRPRKSFSTPVVSGRNSRRRSQGKKRSSH